MSEADGVVHLCSGATSGSWGWLNANGKGGRYGGLNRLGMYMWRRTAPFQDHAIWCGSLIASPSADGEGDGGAYYVNTDIDVADAIALEPELQVNIGDAYDATAKPPLHFHHYPDEGIVDDPRRATAALRAQAMALGVTFVWEAPVETLLYTEGSRERIRATGVRVASPGGAARDIMGDAVVLAAGVGLASAAFRKVVPMQTSPGTLAYTRPTKQGPVANREAAKRDAASSGRRLRGVFVDATTGTHCLERPDGSRVVGGDLSGYGVVTHAPPSSPQSSNDPSGGPGAAASAVTELLERAARWLPELDVTGATGTLAHRVVPSDGFPAIGWSSQVGAYVAASHSGVTLAPILAAVCIAELMQGLELELVDAAWRPDRFIPR